MADVVTKLRGEGLDASSWSNGPGDRYAPHEHDYDKVIAVEAGSIAFGLPATGTTVSLDAGDRLELPAGTAHDAHVGPAGVTCWEAHLSRGRITTVARRAAGEW